MCGFSMSNVTSNVGKTTKLLCTIIFGIDWVLALYTIGPCSVHRSPIDENYYHSRGIEGNAHTQSAKSTKTVMRHYQS
jgi:3-deoxy-D-arabino-heptulosonate 7-phosphate (DAHP) synthase